jgi:hypothetical protein
MVQQKLTTCCPSSNLGQFVSVNTACRVLQVTDTADGLRTDFRYTGSEVSYGQVLEDKRAMYVRVTLY